MSSQCSVSLNLVEHKYPATLSLTLQPYQPCVFITQKGKCFAGKQWTLSYWEREKKTFLVECCIEVM